MKSNYFSSVCPGNQVVSPGVCVGNKLTPEAARELGLPQGIAVAAALIDAHAGGLGKSKINSLKKCCTNAMEGPIHIILQ